jgi:membrane glycosyltransferase
MTTAVTEPASAPKAESSTPLKIVPTLPANRWIRIFFFYSSVLLVTGLVSMIFADLLWRTGWSTSRTILLVLFILLFAFSTIGCMHGVFGFFLRLFGDRSRLTQTTDYAARSLAGTSTAIICPIYNEDVVRVYEGLRVTFESLERTGQLERFDFFIISDSTDPDKWVEEERRWYDLTRELGALGRIYYRRRPVNEGKKSGNVHDFLSTWGRRYRYFIVLDADSVMRGELIVDLVKLMEASPGVGLIQTMPALVNAESFFGRLQQFANRIYAPVFIAGLNYWSRGVGNYWGHNAIIRTDPFMEYCDLPHLPGRKPFGGQILSHDFVEAALMLRENWQVWLAYDLEGSYEEAPQGVIENAQRDRRWCQGNLQHGLVLFVRGLRGTSRMHLLQGILGYLAGPLWLLFLITFCWMWGFQKFTGLSSVTIPGFTPFLHLSGTEHALLVFTICMAVLFLPKLLALADLARDRERQRSFGGLGRAAGGMVAETFFSTLHAPLQMLWHTQFVASNLLGRGVTWSPQKRAADGTAWTYALRRHWGHMLIGLLWGGFIWWLEPSTFLWFAPVFLGMVFSVPFSVFSSRSSLGARARAAGLFLTPEETSPPPELDTLRFRMAAMAGAGETAAREHDWGLAEIVLDPYVNAIHVSLLREKRLNPNYAEQLARLGVGGPEVRVLGAKLLAGGPEALKPDERILVMSDSETMSWLHRQIWLRPGGTLSPWWQAAIRQHAR